MSKFFHSPIDGMRLCSICGADILEENYQRTLEKYHKPMCYRCVQNKLLQKIKEMKNARIRNQIPETNRVKPNRLQF